MKRLDGEKLEFWCRELLQAARVPLVAASNAATVFRLASERNLGHHDLSYLDQRLEWLVSGRVNPLAEARLVSQRGGTEVWDGEGGLGEVLCHHVTHRAVRLSRQFGIGYAVVRHSNHFLAASPYTEIGAAEGCLVIVWSNTDAGMAFPGHHSRQIGNNPLGFGVGSQASGLSADLSLAYSSLGNLHTLKGLGQSAPAHWGTDSLGRPTTDPRELLEGAVGPIGGPKGLALALLGELVTGVLAGGATLDEVAPGGGLNTHNQAVIAWDLEAFGGKRAVEARVASLKSRAAALQAPGRLPGERSRGASQSSKAQGVPIDESTWKGLVQWSSRLGVSLPQHDWE